MLLEWPTARRAALTSREVARHDGVLQRQQPVISVDTKKKEWVGNFKNAGQEWQPTGTPEPVLVHDFPGDAFGKAIPYGVYDTARNEAWVSVGRDHDTPAFAVASIRPWWTMMGRAAHPQADALFHTPRHASWLNQIEIYFSIVQRKVLTPNAFATLAALEHYLLAFQARYQAIATPFRWTFTRADLHHLLARLAASETARPAA